MAKNLGTNYSHRVTLRLNDDQYNFLIEIAKVLDVTPSDYIRMVINTGLVATDGDIQNMIKNSFKRRGGNG